MAGSNSRTLLAIWRGASSRSRPAATRESGAHVGTPVHTRYSLSASSTKPNQRGLLSWGMLDVLFPEIIVQTDDVSSRPSPRNDSTSPPSAQCWPFGVGVADEHLHTQQAPFTARGWLKRQSIGSRICRNTSFLDDVLPCRAGQDRSAVVLMTTPPHRAPSRPCRWRMQGPLPKLSCARWRLDALMCTPMMGGRGVMDDVIAAPG